MLRELYGLPVYTHNPVRYAVQEDATNDHLYLEHCKSSDCKNKPTWTDRLTTVHSSEANNPGYPWPTQHSDMPNCEYLANCNWNPFWNEKLHSAAAAAAAAAATAAAATAAKFAFHQGKELENQSDQAKCALDNFTIHSHSLYAKSWDSYLLPTSVTDPYITSSDMTVEGKLLRIFTSLHNVTWII